MTPSDKIRFLAIEQIIIAKVKDLPDGWDWLVYYEGLKEDVQDLDVLERKIESLEDEILELENEVQQLRKEL